MRTGLGRAALAAGAILIAAPPLAAAPPSPSQPPFWARPQAAPAGPACACDEPAAATTPGGYSAMAVLGGAAAGGLIVLLTVFARRARPAAANGRGRLRGPERRALANGAGAPAAFDRTFDGGRTYDRLPVLPHSSEGPAPRFDHGEGHIELSETLTGAGAADDDVVASLTAALKKDATRQDLRLKLLEIQFAARRADQFVALARQYLDENQGHRDRHWRDIQAMGAELAPEHELFQDFAALRSRRGARRAVAPRGARQFRRFHERHLDQARLYRTQQELAAGYARLKGSSDFESTLEQMLADGVRRPSPLLPAPELAPSPSGATVYLKREDRRRSSDEVLINALGQVLLAQRLGKTRVVTATADGMQGVAVATVAAKLGLQCAVYLGGAEMQRNYSRVLRMRQLGAQVRPTYVAEGSALTDPRQHALDAWLADPEHAQYVSGLSAGPDPYPQIVRELLATVGREALAQVQQVAGQSPAAVVTGSSEGYLGYGLLIAFLQEPDVRLAFVDVPPGGAPDDSVQEAEGSDAPRFRGRRESRYLLEQGRVSAVRGDPNEALRVIEQFHTAGMVLYTETARTLAHARSLARQFESGSAVVSLLSNQDGADMRGHSQDW